MTLWTQSSGILARRRQISACLGQPLARLGPSSECVPQAGDVLLGFSLWKRAFMRTFCAHLADELRFVRRPPRRLTGDEQVLVWGSRYPEQVKAIRVEDGFIRSSGLGSNLCRQSSLSIDPVGIYFDSRHPSALEKLLNYEPIDEALLARGTGCWRCCADLGSANTTWGRACHSCHHKMAVSWC